MYIKLKKFVTHFIPFELSVCPLGKTFIVLLLSVYLDPLDNPPIA
jgi:hypothetical protein